MTGHHRGPKRKLPAGYRTPSLQRMGRSTSAITKTGVMSQAPSLQRTSYFSSQSVVSRAFSGLRVYSTFGHHPDPKATVVPNLVSVATSIAQIAHGERLHTQSVNHSLTPSLFDGPGTEAFAWEQY